MLCSLSVRVLSLGFVLYALGATHVVHACSVPPPCVAPRLLPADGSTIPANATALVLLLGTSFIDASFAPRLLDSVGREIALDIDPASTGAGAVLLRPREPLSEAGEYRLEGLPTATFCAPTTTVESHFFVGPPAPLPRGGGALRVGSQSVDTVPTGCGEEHDEAVAELLYAPDPSLAAWSALAIAQVLADGVPQDLFLPLGAPQRVADSCESAATNPRAITMRVIVPDVLLDETGALQIDLACDSFAGCAAGGAHRAKRRAPLDASGSAFLVVALLVAARRHRRR